MKEIQDRITTLKKEKSILLSEYPSEGSEMQIVMSMINMRIAIELDFLENLPQSLKPSDTDIDQFFPIPNKASLKDTNTITLKRNAVKSFVKHKM